jgi:hypothetical protein
MDALVGSIYHFLYLILLLFHLLFAFFVFYLCHLCMLATALTVVLRTLLVLGTIFFFSFLLNSLFPLLFLSFVIDCWYVNNWLCHPNLFIFTITGEKKAVGCLLFLIPYQQRAACTRIIHAVPAVRPLTCMNHPVSSLTATLLPHRMSSLVEKGWATFLLLSAS